MTRQMKEIMRQVKRFDRLRAMAKRAFRPKKRKRESNQAERGHRAAAAANQRSRWEMAQIPPQFRIRGPVTVEDIMAGPRALVVKQLRDARMHGG